MRTNKKQQKKEAVPEYDADLLERISPLGGIDHMETYSRTGTGYESCLHIWEFPGSLDDYWLTDICAQENGIVTISIHTDDQAEIKKNLNKAIEEQNSRKRFAREYQEFYDAAKREDEMQILYNEISSMEEVIKSVGIRIFTVGKTREELEDVNARILKKLEADTYRAAIFLNESQQEWRSVYYGAEKQLQKGVHALPGLPLKATLLAAGNPFHFSCLEDQTGDFLGTTACGGNVIFDEFTRNMTRVNSSAVIVGNMRFGKSTLLKNRLKARALRGDFLRTFDITGEFSDLTKKLGGRVLNMDGTDGIINLLEIFQAGDTDHTSYTRHLSKIKTTYQFLKPTAEPEEINTLIEMLEILYEKWGLKPSSKKETRITGLPASRYPILSDLQKVLEEEMQRMIAADYREQEVPLVSRKLMYLDNISSQIRLLVNSYGYLFNGPTSVANMTDVKIVTYNLSQLKDMDPQIFDLQLYNILCICWDTAITNGSLMKFRWEQGEIQLEDVVHTLILIDESHRWVNAKKAFALDILGQYLREGPKYFTGIWLASQSIRDYTPEGSTSNEINQLKVLFELAQYKFIFRQDSNTIPIIDQVFNNSLTYSQRERIPRLERGETILCISGDRNIAFKVFLSKADERLFKGGA